MSNLVPPHGGRLLPLLVVGEELKEHTGEAKILLKVWLNSKEESDLIMLAMGAFSPLQGCMRKEDYQRVVEEMRLADGLLWPIPVTLSVSRKEANRIKEGERIALVSRDRDEIIASMLIEEKYAYDKRVEALQVFGTDDEQHPGVKKIYEQPVIYYR